MAEPRWISIESALIAHARQLQRHGGIGGIRDIGLLESALMRPRNLQAFSKPAPDFAALAAAYAGGVVRNHPFLDGNKRTALVVCRAFLLINGFTVMATQDQKAENMLRLASSEITEDDFANWLRKHLRSLDDQSSAS